MCDTFIKFIKMYEVAFFPTFSKLLPDNKKYKKINCSAFYANRQKHFQEKDKEDR